ncbi:hypothetical protein BFU36_02460 [Sulfolobus sp. A20]|uniref:putative RNA uridine N3 methyltransferase n=1 Tax=Sulfolobaceae TaxID=118883 RepID=UPI00084604B0|nr:MULTISPECIES: putative RNA uridine N3 methyltransferase [unclassified Sulfolobus]TRM78963.1 hypothetical protein DJ528_03440 [Sulfolobus sp. B5]TRM81059.1 hypothetical protein DJ524_05460 [Sulfolobus sp. D5]TRM83117.1 hypothetical protein DJ531_06870 [Sulfolobus sp. A20-N-F6]TRM85588.1 hypothetical protein DJ522_00110 [Sulfolobus sp. F3]TRM87220.1 hypothetical protein DJ529_09155 [Sulfolobus sp. C3]TRM94837.1 hypothetical protein DJ526_01370 [Sulfolobus sp. A20-N-G8]TRN01754.1 hypothetica
MYLFPRAKPLNVILFLSLFDIENSMLEITSKLSFILRVTCTFRVNEIFWVKDSRHNEKMMEIVDDVSKYLLAPPYLKKYIPFKSTLRKVGLLSPLNVPSHNVKKTLVEGELRLGRKGDFGFNRKIKTKSKVILVLDSIKFNFIPYINIYYDGIRMKFIEFDDIFKFDNIIVASRSGKNPLESMHEIKELYNNRGLTLLIGPPHGRVLNKLGEKYINSSYNFAINQGVMDIRTEEALAYSLSILNLMLS